MRELWNTKQWLASNYTGGVRAAQRAADAFKRELKRDGHLNVKRKTWDVSDIARDTAVVVGWDCGHPVGTVVDRLDISAGATCDSCGKALELIEQGSYE